MAHIIIANGAFYTWVPGATTFTNISLPSGVSAVSGVRPTFAKYRRAVVINGRFTRGIIYRDDLSTISKLGITAPTAALTVGLNGSGTVTTTSTVAYYTFSHESGTTLVHESNPSPVSNTVVAANNGFSYSGIPSTSSDARVTHVRLYRSDNGGTPKYDGKVAIGTTTASSTTATLSLGTELPTRTSGALDLLARGIPPYTEFCTTYHDRVWYGGDPTYPQRVWFSRTGEPESVRLATDYIDTRNGEAVTGLIPCADQLVVFTSSSTYAIQGYSDGADGTGSADLTMSKISPSIGSIAHHSAVNVGGPNGGDLIFFAAQDGVWSYNGSFFTFMMKDLRTYWRDAYILDKANYEDCIATFDRYWNTYKLLIPATSSSFYYIGHVLPMAEGQPQPDWTFDVRGRRDYTLGVLTALDSQFFETYTGSCDGFLRKENQDSVGSDDGVDKVVKIRLKHYYFGGISGGTNHGNTYNEFDLYAKRENTESFLDFYAGDDFVGEAVTPQKTLTLAAAALTVSTSTYTPKTAEHGVLSNVAGRGITTQFRSTNPVGLEFNGIGLTWKPHGANTRIKSN